MKGFIGIFKKNEPYDDSANEKVRSIQNDELLIDEFINEYKPFIVKSVAQVVGSDEVAEKSEEFCIGRMAFREAVNCYDEGKNGSFLKFSDLLINRRVIEHDRNKVGSVMPIEDLLRSEESHIKEKLNTKPSGKIGNAEIKEEIYHLKEQLYPFGISISDLPMYVPRHNDSKQLCVRIAGIIAGSDEMYHTFNKTKNIPMTELLKVIDVYHGTVERNRKYIIAICIILRNNLEILKSYLRILENRNPVAASIGTVIEINWGKALIMTSECDFVYIRSKANMYIGEQVTYSKISTITLNGRQKKMLATASAVALVFIAFFGLYHLLSSDGPSKPTGRGEKQVQTAALNEATTASDSTVEVESAGDNEEDPEPSIEVSPEPDAVEPTAPIEPTDSSANEQLVAPQVKGRYINGKVVLSWKPINHPLFKSYKVVVSKRDRTPTYPENGYMVSIDDKSKKSVVITNSMPYKNGDFGEYLKPGEKYYFSVAAVYADDTIKAGRALSLVYPAAATPSPLQTPVISPTTQPAPQEQISQEQASQGIAPVVNGEIRGDKILLSWKPVAAEGFRNYKVIISKNNSTPSYPQDGYLYYIDNRMSTSVEINNRHEYKKGDFGGYLVPGERYYITVIAFYETKSVTGNVISIEYPQ